MNLEIFVVISEMRKLSFNAIEELASKHGEVPRPGAQVGFMVPNTNSISLNKDVKKKIMPKVLERALQLRYLEAITSTVRYLGKIQILIQDSCSSCGFFLVSLISCLYHD